MTNTCHNRMKITGPISEITRFKQTCIRAVCENKQAQFDFNAIDPMPDFFGDNDALPYNDALKVELALTAHKDNSEQETKYMRVITLQDLRQHVFDLWGKADGIEWAEAGLDAVAYHDTGMIRIHPITSEAAYATALHEIGHLRRGMHEDVLVNERWAWEWAQANALVWTPTMACEAERSLGSYEAAFADEAHKKDYYYKQILAFVNDLLVGGCPDGLEVCDALVLNAVELAQLYRDDRARRVLLGLVDKYLPALR